MRVKTLASIEETHNESEDSAAQQLEETQSTGVEESEHVVGEEGDEEPESLQKTASENQRKMLEFPPSVSAGSG